MNAEWHKKHPMPKNPSLKERIEWHLEHSRECGCRPAPPGMQKLIKRGSRKS